MVGNDSINILIIVILFMNLLHDNVKDKDNCINKNNTKGCWMILIKYNIIKVSVIKLIFDKI
jgi:hypothetical protein